MAKRNIVKRNKTETIWKTFKNHLLVIAIDDYQHCPSLNNAVKDAKDFIAVLTQQYNFEASNVIQLFNKDASKSAIIAAFRQMIEKLKEGDNILIYFSGHGAFDDLIDQGFWVSQEAKKDSFGDYLPNDLIIRYIRALKTHHVVMLIDSCFSGTLVKNPKSVTKGLEKDPSRYVLASGRKEFADDGTPGKNSPFAKSIIDYLKKNTSEEILITDLAQHVKKETIKATNDSQRPIGNPLQIPEDQGGEFVFRLKTANEEGIWEIAQEKKTIKAYEEYLKTFPKGEYVEEAHWQIALKRNTEAAYDDYLDLFPKGEYSQIAEEKMLAIEDQNAWEQAQERDSITAYRKYLRTYKKGKFRAEVEELLKTLKSNQTPKIIADTPEIIKPELIIPAKPKIQTSLYEEVFVEGGTYLFQGKHEVELGDFYIGKYPVTFDLYDRFCEEIGWELPKDEGWGRGKRPVINISWYNALTFCNWLSEQVGLEKVYENEGDKYKGFKLEANGYRLPTEVMWEFAARGGNLSKGFKYAGSNDLNEVGWYWKNSGDKKLSGDWALEKLIKNNCRTQLVGRLKANELGIQDINGNVWEWCMDEWTDKVEEIPKKGINPFRGAMKKVPAWFVVGLGATLISTAASLTAMGTTHLTRMTL